MSLYEGTELFCAALVENMPATLDKLLSPNCRMQSSYGKATRNANGLVECIEKLNEVQVILFRLAGAYKIDILLVSDTQSFIFCSSNHEPVPLRMGIALEWECNIVTGIVCAQEFYKIDVDTLMYMVYHFRGGRRVISSVELLKHEQRELSSDICHNSDSINDCIRLDVIQSDSIDEGGTHNVGHTTGKSVSFCKFARVALIPLVDKTSSLFYCSQDYRRFSVDKEHEIEQATNMLGISREEATVRLYMPEEGELYTEINNDLSFGSTDEGNIEDGVRVSLLSDRGTVTSRYFHQRRAVSDSAFISPPLALRDVLPSDFGSNEYCPRMSMDDDIDRSRYIFRNHKRSEFRLSVDLAEVLQNGHSFSVPSQCGPRSVSVDGFVGSTYGEKQSRYKQSPRNSIGDLQGRYRRRSVESSTSSRSSIMPSQIPPFGWVLGRELSLPDVLQPVIVLVTVVACNNLPPSAFWPLLSVDSYVEIEVNGEVRRTEVCRRHKNPIYDSTQLYCFSLSCEEALGNRVKFSVFDAAKVGTDTSLGVAAVPFSALKIQCDDLSPTSVILPLRRELDEMEIGRGFCNSDNYHLTQTSENSKQKKTSTRRIPTISVLISLVSVSLYSILNDLKVEDETLKNSGDRQEWVTLPS